MPYRTGPTRFGMVLAAPSLTNAASLECLMLKVYKFHGALSK